MRSRRKRLLLAVVTAILTAGVAVWLVPVRWLTPPRPHAVIPEYCWPSDFIFSPQGSVVAIISGGPNPLTGTNRLQLRDGDTGQLRAELDRGKFVSKDSGFSSDGKLFRARIWLGDGAGARFKVWDVESGMLIETPDPLPHFDASPYTNGGNWEISRDGQFVGHAEGTVAGPWLTRTREWLGWNTDPRDWNHEIRISYSGSWRDVVWLPGGSWAHFSPDGKLFAVARSEGVFLYRAPFRTQWGQRIGFGVLFGAALPVGYLLLTFVRYGNRPPSERGAVQDA
jgi:hypothetical protein